MGRLCDIGKYSFHSAEVQHTEDEDNNCYDTSWIEFLPPKSPLRGTLEAVLELDLNAVFY